MASKVTEVLDELKALVSNGPDVEVAVASNSVDDKDSSPRLRTLNLAESAEEFFRRLVVKSVVRPAPRWHLRPLDILYKPEEREVEYRALTEADPVQLALDSLENLAPAEAFDPSDASVVSGLRYSTIVLTRDDGERAYFFRIFTAANELRQKPWAALILRDGAYSEVEEQIFLFSEQVDCFVFKGLIFVLNKNNYRKIFGLFERIRKEAGQAADALNAVVPISNFEEFRTACCSQTTMADKVIEVSKRDYFALLSVSKLKPIIDEFELNVELDEDEESLVFDPRPGGRWHILRLVDDDYLRSSLTDHRYEVNSKTSM